MSLLIATSFAGLQIIITALILGFTSSNSALRVVGLIPMIYCAYVQTPYIIHLLYPLYRGFLGNAVFVLVMQYIDTVLLHRWTFAARGPTSSIGGLKPVDQEAPKNYRKGSTVTVGDIWKRLQFGLGVSLQSRFPVTKWPVKNIPPFSRKQPDYVPSKAVFLRAMILKWSLNVFLLDLAGLFNNSGNNTVTFSSERIPFFTRLAKVSPEELFARSVSIMAFWTMQYIVIEVVYGALAIVAVALGITSVSAWPPMFGSISDSYSLRQFWG